MTPVADSPPQLLTTTNVRIVAPAQHGSASANWQPKDIPLKIKNPAAPWLRDTIDEVQQLTALKSGWDSYKASPVTAASATRAVLFLVDTAYERLARPSVVPLADGGIQLEWHRGGMDLEISFSDVKSSVYFEDSNNGESRDESIEDAGQLVRSNLQRLHD